MLYDNRQWTINCRQFYFEGWIAWNPLSVILFWYLDTGGKRLNTTRLTGIYVTSVYILHFLMIVITTEVPRLWLCDRGREGGAPAEPSSGDRRLERWQRSQLALRWKPGISLPWRNGLYRCKTASSHPKVIRRRPEIGRINQEIKAQIVPLMGNQVCCSITG